MAKQLSLFKEPRRQTKRWWILKQTTYGGSLNYRKVARPFDRKKLVHAVLKANLGRALAFSRFPNRHRQIIRSAADRYGVQLRDLALHHDHIHLLYVAGTPALNAQFLRFVSAQLGRKYARLKRALGLRNQPLWTHRPFTRLVSWGRKSLENVLRYIRKNRLEALGFVSYQARKRRLTAFLLRWEKQIFSTA